MKAEKANFTITFMCAAFGVKRCAYDAWHAKQLDGKTPKELDDEALTARIKQVFDRSKQTYGPLRITKTLNDHGIACAHGRVENLMKRAGFCALHKPRKVRTTLAYEGAFEITDHVKRDFYHDEVHTLFCGDIKHIPTGEGALYLSTVIDLCSRRCVHYELDDNMRAELVERTLDGALGRLGVDGDVNAIFHSDQGSQYLSDIVGRFCETHGITQSTGRVGTCYDNAGAESFFATLEKEVLARATYETREQARIAIFEFIETWYNTERLHSTLEYHSPATFEQLSELEQRAIMQRSKQKAEKRKQKRLDKIKQQHKMRRAS